MVVLGGTALTGGRGTILGTVLGILILRVMRNGIVLIGCPVSPTISSSAPSSLA
jgi:simple sugar transport system permease protein